VERVSSAVRLDLRPGEWVLCAPEVVIWASPKPRESAVCNQSREDDASTQGTVPSIPIVV
jgi:hypothetical protein